MQRSYWQLRLHGDGQILYCTAPDKQFRAICKGFPCIPWKFRSEEEARAYWKLIQAKYPAWAVSFTSEIVEAEL